MATTRVTANVNIYINGNSTDAETQQFAGALIEGGSDALLTALKRAKPLGRISLVGRVGFYDLKLVRSRPTETGERIIAVTDRPIGFLKAYSWATSEDYKLGVLVLDLQTQEKGNEESEGALIYAARIKITDGNEVEIENYGITPVRLMIVRKL